MKQGIHPKYYKAQVKCVCGNEFEVGATKELIEVEVCHNCHPFYTGDDKGKMRGGRVDKFRERAAKKSDSLKKKTAKKRK